MVATQVEEGSSDLPKTKLVIHPVLLSPPVGVGSPSNRVFKSLLRISIPVKCEEV
jgi:hypothetical protein